MQFLETKPHTRVVAIITLVALVATVLVRQQFAEAERIMSARGYGIIPYELAFTPQRANAILEAWGPEVEPYARHSLLVDFAFMPSYALLFAGVTLLIARTAQGGLRRAGLWMVRWPFVAAVLDAVENIMLLSMLGHAGEVAAGPPLVAGAAAALKFLLLIATVLYWLVGVIAWVVRKVRPA